MRRYTVPTIGQTELIVILAIVPFLFGASRLPEIGSAPGKTVRSIKEATREE